MKIRVFATAVSVASALAVASPVIAQDPEPGTPEWQLRDLDNMERSTRRQQDELAHPAYGFQYWTDTIPIHVDNVRDQVQHPDRPVVSLSRILPGETGDPYRQHWGGARGVQQPIEYLNSCGARIQGTVFAPMLADGSDATFPGIVITTGSIDGYEELYWWAAQGLAEAGYVVMTYDIMGQGESEESCHDEPQSEPTGFQGGTIDALRWFLSDANPLRNLIDDTRLGLAGHSAGAFAVGDVGNRAELPLGPGGALVANPVDAVVGWDFISAPPDGARVPTMSQTADYFFNPQPTSEPTDPESDDKRSWIAAFDAAGVPWMHVAFRSSTHIEWTFVPYILPATRQGERVAMHYTLAWFDQYVKGVDATARLTATVFDGSADASSIGMGCWDPATNGNVPYTIGGECVAEHLSIYHQSSYDLENGTHAAPDMRALGCPPGALGLEQAIPCGS